MVISQQSALKRFYKTRRKVTIPMNKKVKGTIDTPKGVMRKCHPPIKDDSQVRDDKCSGDTPKILDGLVFETHNMPESPCQPPLTGIGDRCR